MICLSEVILYIVHLTAFPPMSYYSILNHYIDQCPIFYNNGNDKRILIESNML